MSPFINRRCHSNRCSAAETHGRARACCESRFDYITNPTLTPGNATPTNELRRHLCMGPEYLSSFSTAPPREEEEEIID